MNSILTPDLKSQIETTLDTIRPYLRVDGGDVELVDVLEDMTVQLRLKGACSSCDMSHMTMRAGIEEGLKKTIPGITAVVAVA